MVLIRVLRSARLLFYVTGQKFANGSLHLKMLKSYFCLVSQNYLYEFP